MDITKHFEEFKKINYEAELCDNALHELCIKANASVILESINRTDPGESGQEVWTENRIRVSVPGIEPEKSYFSHVVLFPYNAQDKQKTNALNDAIFYLKAKGIELGVILYGLLKHKIVFNEEPENSNLGIKKDDCFTWVTGQGWTKTTEHVNISDKPGFFDEFVSLNIAERVEI